MINDVLRMYAYFKPKIMIAMDDSSMHKIPEIIKSAKLSKIKVIMIPGGLTKYLKSLYVSINTLFEKLEESTMSIENKIQI